MNVNAETFRNPDKYASYIMGLIWADGYINKTITKNKGLKFRISLEICTDDFNDVKDCFVKTGNWMFYERTRKPTDGITRKPISTAITCNKELHEVFTSLDYGNKSICSPKFVLDLSELNQSYWFRGYFDGDGCVYKIPNSNSFQIHFGGTYDQNWSVQEKLLNNIGIYPHIKQTITPKGHRSSVLRFLKFNEVKSFYNFIYQDGFNNIGFRRKFDKFGF